MDLSVWLGKCSNWKGFLTNVVLLAANLARGITG
jgi:hypothetical protein